MRQKVNKTVQPILSQSDRDALDYYFMHRNLRDRVMFVLGIYTGRRISDLVRLNVRDVAHIDPKDRLCIVERLMLHEQKTGKFAAPLIHPKVRQILSKYLRARLLVSKGLITKAELARETERVKSSEKYDFDVHEAERDIEVFRAMLDLCIKK